MKWLRDDIFPKPSLSIHQRKIMSKKIIVFLWALFCFNTCLTAGVPAYFPDELEADLIKQINSTDESNQRQLLSWRLADLRLQKAATTYRQWEKDKDPQAFQTALLLAESATQLRPDWDEAWLTLGMLYAEMRADRKSMELATEALVRAVEANPANGRAQTLLGETLMLQGRYWSAIEQFQSLIEKNDSMHNGTILSKIIFCYIADGRPKAGLQYISTLKTDQRFKGDSGWLMIAEAMLQKADGSPQKALSGLKKSLGTLKKAPMNHLASIKQADFLIKRWEKEG